MKNFRSAGKYELDWKRCQFPALLPIFVDFIRILYQSCLKSTCAIWQYYDSLDINFKHILESLN